MSDKKRFTFYVERGLLEEVESISVLKDCSVGSIVCNALEYFTDNQNEVERFLLIKKLNALQEKAELRLKEIENNRLELSSDSYVDLVLKNLESSIENGLLLKALKSFSEEKKEAIADSFLTCFNIFNLGATENE
jgi:hypothetical protein